MSDNIIKTFKKYLYMSLGCIGFLSLSLSLYIVLILNRLAASFNELVKTQSLISSQLETLSISTKIQNALELTKEDISITMWVAPFFFCITVLIALYFIKSSSCIEYPSICVSEDLYIQTVQNVSKDIVHSLEINRLRTIPSLDFEFQTSYLHSFSITEELGFQQAHLVDNAVNTGVEVLIGL